jgi:predicted TIM-barrel fold metal-dependent hydrolase
MKFIDMHTHIYPANIADRAAQSIRDFYRLDGEGMDGTGDMLLKQGEKAGISRYLILPVAVKPEQVSSINHYIQSQTIEHECFLGFGTVHAGMADITGEAERIAAMGLKGIKIHPDCQHFDIDDARLFPLYEAVQGKLPIMIHMGDDRHDHSHPARLRRVLQMFPQLQVCAAHFGGHTMYETARENLSDTSCIMDISSTLMFMEREQAERYINHYGAERLAFGTDYPIWDPVREVGRFLSLNITEEQKEQIAHKTAERFLNL